MSTQQSWPTDTEEGGGACNTGQPGHLALFVVRRQSRYPLSMQIEHKTKGAVQNTTLDLFSPLPVGRDLLGGPVPLILSPLLQQRVTIASHQTVYSRRFSSKPAGREKAITRFVLTPPATAAHYAGEWLFIHVISFLRLLETGWVCKQSGMVW